MNENNTEKTNENLPLEDHDSTENDPMENGDTVEDSANTDLTDITDDPEESTQEEENANGDVIVNTDPSQKYSCAFTKRFAFVCSCICVCFIICFAIVVGKVGFAATTVIYQNESWQNPGEEVTENAIVNAAAKASPSVVAITTERISYTAFGNYVSEGAGSGVICTEDGYIITNHHVISGATNIMVTLENGDTHRATLIGSDSKTDLAIVKINASGLRPAVFANADSIMVGQTVLAIGNPLGSLSNTVTSGIVSALARQIKIESTKMTLLQHSAAVSPGNSGGGLFNTNGELIGIVNAKSSGESIEGIGYAIPMQTVTKIVTELIENRKYSEKLQLGITGYEILTYQKVYSIQNEKVREAFINMQRAGVYISTQDNVNYADGSEKLQTGDYLSAIDNQLIYEFNDINLYLINKNPGETAKLTIYRYDSETKKTAQINVSIILTEKK